MWGVLLGAASIFGLSRLFRYRAWRYGYGGCRGGYRGYGYGWPDYDSESRDFWHRRRDFGGPPRFILRRLFQYLDTTPGQEKVIAEAFDTVVARLRESKGDLSKTRQDLADVIRKEQLEPEKLREILSEQQDRVNQAGTSVSEAVAKIHAVLDAKQRERLAEIVESGFRRGSRSPWHDV